MTAERRAVAAAVSTALQHPGAASAGRIRLLTHGSLSALALTIGLIASASAQETTETGAGARDASLEEITVTGSRIRRTTDFDTPNPTTVVDANYLENLGIVNVGDAVASLPANVSNNTPTTTGNANFFAGSTIANLRGLNPFFGSRTLNLVNNRRFVPTNQGDGLDLNFIPQILVERIDIVTGGASAAYGSGAISGVNNIFLDRKMEGGKLDVDFFQTSESDGDDKHLGAAYGFALADGRAHVVLGYEYQDSDPVGCLRARDWCARGTGFRQGIPGVEPTLVLADNVRFNQSSLGGVFQGQGLQVNADGATTAPYTIGSGNNGVPFNVVEGGDGASIYQYTNLRAPVERNVATAVFTMDVTDATTLGVDVSWGEVVTVNRTGALNSNFVPILGDNAFIQGRPALVTAVGGFALLNKDWNAQVDSFSRFTTDVKRLAISLDGKFGESSWTWDTYYQFGESNREQLVNDNLHLVQAALALDSVIGPNGQPRCRIANAAEAQAFLDANVGNPAVTPFDPRLADGCLPINPFGTGAIDTATQDYTFGFLRENLEYRQQVLAFNVSGDLFKEGFGAGAVQAAAGIEFRKEEGENIAAEELNDWTRTDFLIQYGESFSGDVDVTEGFVEVNLPLLRDRPGAQLLEFNTAARYSEYKNKGLAGTTGEERTHDMTTWKVSGLYDPVDWLRFRGSRSRDSRAANFRELYYGQIIQSGGLFGFCEPGGTTPRDPCTWSLEGNVDLEPEKADTTTFGIVFRPTEAIPGFEFAADYFHIEINEAIQQANVFRVRDGCRISGIQEFCDLITFGDPALVNPANPLSNINLIRALAFNGSGYEFKGIDFTGSYLWELNDSSNLNFRLLATKMLEQNFQATPGQPFIDIVGQTGTGNSFLSDNQPTAELIANFSATYNRGPASVTGLVRYISDGIMDYMGVTSGTVPPGFRLMSTNEVPSYTVFSLSGSYKFEEIGPLSSVQLFAAIDNVFDKDPPVAPGGGGFGPSNVNGGTNAVFFDTLGRSFRLGVRTRF
jgi:iron complex outermembrane receptor protein